MGALKNIYREKVDEKREDGIKIRLVVADKKRFD